MKTTKKLLSALLALCMALSLLPLAATSARAEADEPAIPKPAMPEFETCTKNSITLKAVTPPEGCTVKYGIADKSYKKARWQTETTFTKGADESDLTDTHPYYFYVCYCQGEEIIEQSEPKALRLHPASKLPSEDHLSTGIGVSNYAVYDEETGKVTALWDKENCTLTLDGFVGAEGQYLTLALDSTVLLKGENVFDCGPNSISLNITNGRNIVLRGADEGARLAVRGMDVRTNVLRIENCTLDASWTFRDGKYCCATVKCPEITLTDARLLCPAPPRPASDGIGSCAFDLDGWKESCSITLTRSVLRVAAPEKEDEALCSDCFYHCGDDEAQQPSLLALALADHSAVELNGKNTVFTRLGAIALSADETSSAVFRGNVFVNDVNSKGDISLGGNITIDMETGHIKASALRITAPGVTVTAAEYHFNRYDPAEGVAAVPSIDVHKEEGLGGWLVVEGDVRLTGTVRFVETPAKTGIKTAEPIKDGLRCLLTAPADSLLIAASYDKNGALTGVATARIAEACELAEHTVALRLEEGGSYRLMLVNASTFAPLCASRGART